MVKTRREQVPRSTGQRPVEREAGADSRLTYTVDEVAGLLGLSRSAVYECIARGQIPGKRLGRRVVVVRAALDAFLAEPDVPRRPPGRHLRRLA